MQARVERLIGDHAQLRIEQMARLHEIDRGYQPMQILDLVGAKQHRRRLPEQLLKRHAEQAGGVAGRLQHLQRVGVQHQHRAVWEDRSRDVDRLLIAV